MQEEPMERLTGAFVEAARALGLKVKSAGYGGYSHGSFYNMEVRYPDGFEVYVEINESQDEEYLSERYGEGGE